MATHVIVGAGPIGSATARLLADDGHEVRAVTRGGAGPAHEQIQRISADATDVGRLADLCAGATVLYNCANPPYHRWRTDWPPLAEALLRAAETSGAVLVTMSNLYGYGEVNGPMREDLPLTATTSKGRVRAQMWRDALAAHEAGLIRATEARASDFIGAGAHSLFTDMVAPAVRSGRPALVPANFDVPHSVTYTGDAARTLVALGSDERAWGRPWHVPTAPAVTLGELAARLASLAGAPGPRLRTMSPFVLRLGGVFSPMAREFIEMRYQFDRPFVLDSSAAEQTFGLTPTSLDDALRTMVT
jgi:nucleoside-diphosphate-sugar epimerase